MNIIFSFLFIGLIFLASYKVLNTRLLFIFSIGFTTLAMLFTMFFLDGLINVIYDIDMNVQRSMHESIRINNLIYPLQNFVGWTIIWSLIINLILSTMNIVFYKETISIKVISVITGVICILIGIAFVLSISITRII
jgi:hypothetical protein